MKLFILAPLACLIALGAENPRLMQVHSVYILQMGSGIDQFLAGRLTHLGKMQVVANPQLADTILTDRLGEPFEKKLDELYGEIDDPVEKVDKQDKDTKAVKDAKDSKDEKSEKDVKGGNDAPSANVSFKDDQPMRASSFGRGRGNFFLVDRKTRNVLWSTYERPKSSSPDDLNRTAERVINNLKRDLKP